MGIRKTLSKIRTLAVFSRFAIRRFLYGMDSAMQLTRTMDKRSLVYILRKYGATIGEQTDIESGLTFHNCKDFTNLVIGDFCHIGKNCFFDLKDKIKIGNRVTISMESMMITHQDPGYGATKNRYPMRSEPIRVDDDVYLGARVTILMGRCIGQGAVVGANALVLHDVAPHSTVVGVPASEIHKRQI